MTAEDMIMVIDKPHFIVKLHKTLLEVDLKEGVRKELEDFVEAKPILRETLGLLFQTVIPLDVELKNIQSVEIDKKGRVKVIIPSRRDLLIPLDRKESERLVEKLDELIAIEKQRFKRDVEEAKRTQRESSAERGMMETELDRRSIR
jgi:virulence-associated protein VagC